MHSKVPLQESQMSGQAGASWGSSATPSAAATQMQAVRSQTDRDALAAVLRGSEESRRDEALDSDKVAGLQPPMPGNGTIGATMLVSPEDLREGH